MTRRPQCHEDGRAAPAAHGSGKCKCVKEEREKTFKSICIRNIPALYWVNCVHDKVHVTAFTCTHIHHLQAMLKYSAYYCSPSVTSQISLDSCHIWHEGSPVWKYLHFRVRWFLILTCIVPRLCNKLCLYFKTGVCRSGISSLDLFCLCWVLLWNMTLGWTYTNHEKSSLFCCQVIDLLRNEPLILPRCTLWPTIHNRWYQPVHASCN